MKKDNIYNNIEDLFREVIGESEITPGENLSHNVMRKLGRKEFLRFNPYRFNIWYLAGLITATSVAGLLLLSSDSSEKKSELPVSNKQNTETGISADTVIVPEGKIDTGAFVLPVEGKDREIISKRVKTTDRTPLHESPVSTRSQSSQKEGAGKVVSVSVASDTNTEKESYLLTAGIKASALSGCVPLHIKFSNSYSGKTVSAWDFGDGGTSDQSDPEWIYDIPGVYKVTLLVEDEKERSAITSITINVWPKPQVAFEIVPEDPVIPDDGVSFVNLSTGASSYKWYFGDGVTSEIESPVHVYEKYGKYNVSLVALSENGCIDSVSLSDAFTDTGCYLRFPNAFTPNIGGPTGGYYSKHTDQGNLVFHPVCSGVTGYNLKIYSKQGYLVFESDDIYIGWDGYYKGKLCSSGVYVWKARGTFRNGETYVMSGDVTLVNY